MFRTRVCMYVSPRCCYTAIQKRTETGGRFCFPRTRRLALHYHFSIELHRNRSSSVGIRRIIHRAACCCLSIGDLAHLAIRLTLQHRKGIQWSLFIFVSAISADILALCYLCLRMKLKLRVRLIRPCAKQVVSMSIKLHSRA